MEILTFECIRDMTAALHVWVMQRDAFCTIFLKEKCKCACLLLLQHAEQLKCNSRCLLGNHYIE